MDVEGAWTKLGGRAFQNFDNTGREEVFDNICSSDGVASLSE